MTERFAPEVLDRLRTTKEVRIETRRPPDGPVHRTIIWVVVSGERAFVRTYMGAGSRWYREALLEPDVVLLVGRDRVMAGVDCGFSVHVGTQGIDPDVTWGKLRALSEGAAIASERLWG